MKKEIDGNDPCWCGSGLEYKNCHLDREKQEPLSFWDVAENFRSVFNNKECLAPDIMKSHCSKTISKAHTVTKSGSLDRISRNGYVYSFIPTLENISKNGRLKPQLVHINHASTFSGFCSAHDNAIFANIERYPFIGSQEQCFILAYRALAKELYTKKAAKRAGKTRKQADRGKSLDQQYSIQTLNSLTDVGISVGLRDINYYKALYDQILITKNYDNVRSLSIELNLPPPVMCSGGFFPLQDFLGNQLQDLGDSKVLDLITVNSFYSSPNGYIVFTWLKENDSYNRRFIDSLRLLPPFKTTSAIIQLFFGYLENLHISPDWWEGLEINKKEYLINKQYSAASILTKISNNLSDDSVHFSNWGITKIQTIGF